MVTKWFKINRWLDKLDTQWRNLKHGVKNIIIWFPTVWKDRWWDHHFFFVILHKKLSLMEKNFREHGHHLNHEKDADKMKRCVLLLDRIIKDEYHDMVFKNHDEKWGDIDFKFTPCEDREGYSELDIIRSNAKTKEEKEQERQEFRRIMRNPEKLLQQDVDTLFKFLNKHIRTWWD